MEDSHRRDSDSRLEQRDGLENDERGGHEPCASISKRGRHGARRVVVVVGHHQQCVQC